MAKILRHNRLTTKNLLVKVNVSDIYSNFLRAKKSVCSESTYRIYENLGSRIIVPQLELLTDDNMNAITPDVLRTIIENYQSSHDSGGHAFVWRHLKSFVNWYWTEYEIPLDNPVKRVQIRKTALPPKEGISQLEIDKLLKAIKEHSQFPERDTAFILLLCDTGLRRRSIFELKMADVDIVHSELTVHEKDQQYHTKPFGVVTCKALKKYLLCVSDTKPTDPFWLCLDGSALTQNGMREIIRRLSSWAGIPMHEFHDFRRYYGLQIYNSTHDIYLVSRALDHKSVEVTKRYLAIDNRENAEAVRPLSPMDKKFRQTGAKVQR